MSPRLLQIIRPTARRNVLRMHEDQDQGDRSSETSGTPPNYTASQTRTPESSAPRLWESQTSQLVRVRCQHFTSLEVERTPCRLSVSAVTRAWDVCIRSSVGSPRSIFRYQTRILGEKKNINQNISILGKKFQNVMLLSSVPLRFWVPVS